MFILYFRTSDYQPVITEQRCASVLRYLPFYYDELIFLPLPFMADIIANAYHANPTAARQSIDYLITSTNLQKTARQAIEQIAHKSLSNCKTTEDIIALPDALSWISSEYQQDIWGEFTDISIQVGTAINATSPYRAGKLMEHPIRMLHQMRTDLSRSDVGTAVAYGIATEQWLSVLETARRTLEERARSQGEIPQEYIAGPSLKPYEAGNRFKGRTDIFREIEMLVLSPQRPTLLLYGQRRIGKTSLLRYLPHRLGSQILPVIIDVQETAQASTLTGVAQNMASQMMKSVPNLPEPDSKSFEADPFIALGTWFDRIESSFGSKVILLCLDEFERLQEIVNTSNSKAPLNFLRAITQNRKQMGLLLSGSHTREELAGYWSDYLIGTRTVVLDYLTESETRELIRSPVDDFPDIYAPEAVEKIWRLTSGQPMLTQLICYEIVELLNLGKRLKADTNDVETVIPKAFMTAYQYFDEFWTTLTDEERHALKLLAKNSEMSENENKDAISRLLRRGVVIRSDSEYRIRVPLICRWIVSNG